VTDNLSPWQQPEWLDSVHAWIRAELTRQQLNLTGEIEQPHLRPWSTVLRAPTEAGLVYFKASAPYFGHETALTAFLARQRPELTPDLLAVDLTRHWLLMRDSGTPLRAFIKTERSIDRWQAILPLYVDLQKSLMTHREALLALGLLDRRLERLPELFDQLVANETALLFDQPDGLTADEYQRLKACGPRFGQMCARLAAFGIPETIHHDDFHDGNIFIQDGRVIFTDWGESALTHPFFTLVVMLRGLENTLDLQPDDPKVLQLRDWYLSYWTDYAPLAELRSVVGLAQQIGYVNRALTWQMVISNLPEALKPEYAVAVPAYLQEFINHV
jgi:hypothetical protein